VTSFGWWRREQSVWAINPLSPWGKGGLLAKPTEGAWGEFATVGRIIWCANTHTWKTTPSPKR